MLIMLTECQIAIYAILEESNLAVNIPIHLKTSVAQLAYVPLEVNIMNTSKFAHILGD